MLGQIDLTSYFNSIEGTDQSSTVPCLLGDGPLQVGQSYCIAPLSTSMTPAVAGCPAGATCTIVPSISNTNIYLALAAVAALFVGVSMFGGHHR